MRRYSTEPRTKKYVKGYGFLSFERNLSNKYRKQLLDSATRTGLDVIKTASKKVGHKTADTTGKFIGNKIADKTEKTVPDVNFFVIFIFNWGSLYARLNNRCKAWSYEKKKHKRINAPTVKRKNLQLKDVC